MKEYWFARRFPLDNPRSGMAPVHWKGWAAAGVFIAAMLLGGVSFAWMAAHGAVVQGAVVFAIAAAIGLAWFVSISVVKGDRSRTVEDYRKIGRA